MNAIDVMVPNGVSGDWKVETFEVSKEESSFSRIRAMQNPNEYVEAGTYKRLMRRGTVVMSNTRMELETNRPIIRAAQGSVLINGLGLGMVLTAILPRTTVKEVIVVEKSSDVIRLVAPTFLEDKRVTIIEGDAFTYQPPKGKRYDCVWHDIWDTICSDNLQQMSQLTRKYARRCDWQDCWAKIECLRAQRRGY